MAKLQTDASEDVYNSSFPTSCLRKNKNPRQTLRNRSVSFPDDDTRIVTSYFEPVNPWIFSQSITKEALLSSYIASCEKHLTKPIRKVLDQLEEYPYGNGSERFEELSLEGEHLSLGCCEALEDILKRVQFDKLNLEDTGIDDEVMIFWYKHKISEQAGLFKDKIKSDLLFLPFKTQKASVALFDMIEYYEAATQLNISNNPNIGVRGWQACSRMLKRTKSLEQLECRSTPLNEALMQYLSKALRLGTQLQVLKLENCSISGRPLIILVAGLKMNSTLKELYLGDNDLISSDAAQLGVLLKCNFNLQLLDISNNEITDVGLGHICDALCEQNKTGGLNILVAWNNKLTTHASLHIQRALRHNDSLEMLNIGRNDLGDEFLHNIKDALTENKTLLRIGMQSTCLTKIGASALGRVITNNPTLQRIDLRDNNLQVEGLQALAEAMKFNSNIMQLDIDNCPPNKLQMAEGVEKYLLLLEEIKNYCNRNESGGDEALLRAKLNSVAAARKISLTCDAATLNRISKRIEPVNNSFLQVDTSKKSGRLRSPAPSPIPSPVASPSPTRTRFQVSKVCEDSPPDNVFFGNTNFTGTRSRFRVTTVSDTEEDSPPPIIVKPVNVPRVVPVLETPVPDEAKKTSTPPRTRKFSSWMNPGIFAESRAASGIEKLMGLFHNPFSAARGTDEQSDTTSRVVNNNNNRSASIGESEMDSGNGATWPQAIVRPVSSPGQSPHSTSAPSLTALTVIPPTG